MPENQDNSYRVEIKWRGNFHWSSYGEPYTDYDKALSRGKSAVEAHGNGGAKGVRVVDDSEKVLWHW